MKTILLILALLLCADLCNGFMDSIQFHWADSLPGRRNWPAQWWNPAYSWKNKYDHDEQGKMIKPLRPAYWGSTTFLSWTTDAWHFFKLMYRGLLRTVVVILASLAFRAAGVRMSFWIALILWFGIAMWQAVGFHLTYSIL